MQWEDIAKAHWLSVEGYAEVFREKQLPFGFSGTQAPAQPSFHHVKQVHGCAFKEADHDTRWEAEARPEADAIWTKEPNRRVAIKTADCLPVLIWNPHVVMAIHAGWRGMAAGIVQQGIRRAAEIGGAKGQTKVCIGPAISSQGFEIGPEVKQELQSTAPWSWLYSKGKDDRWHADLQAAAVAMTIHMGVSPQNVFCIRTCTRYEPGPIWHSYRRQGTDAGRNWSWVER